MAESPELDLEVLYCHDAAPAEQARSGFGVAFAWDVPLLDGYRHRFLQNVATTPSVGTFDGLSTPELWEVISRDRYDAVVVNGWHYRSAWQGIRASWRRKVPVLVRSDSHLRTARHPLKTLVKAMPYRWFVPRLDGCLAVGTWSSEYFRHYGARPERIFVVPHVVDDSFSKASRALAPRAAELRARWQLDSTQVVFVFVGKFIDKKRPLDFVRAIAHAHKSNPRVAGLMVGDGPLRAMCEQLVCEANAPIGFTGFLNQSEIAQAYVAADALVLPSDGGETWGLVVNEAMSCGLPCFVSDHVGCGPDLVVDDETGVVFTLGDAEALGSKLASFAATGPRLTAMGAAARSRIEAYSIPSVVESLVRALSSVVAA